MAKEEKKKGWGKIDSYFRRTGDALFFVF